MKSNQILQDFYDVCEICGDDFNLVAELIHFHNSKEERLSRILTDITEYHDMKRIERYAKIFDHFLSLTSSYIKVFIEIKRGKIKSQLIKIDRSTIHEEFKINSRAKEYIYMFRQDRKRLHHLHIALTHFLRSINEKRNRVLK